MGCRTPPLPQGCPTHGVKHPPPLLTLQTQIQTSIMANKHNWVPNTHKKNSKNQSKHTPFLSLDLPHLRVMLLCLDKQMHTGLTSHLRFPHTPQLRADKTTRGNFPVRYFPPPTCNSCNYVSSLSESQPGPEVADPREHENAGSSSPGILLLTVVCWNILQEAFYKSRVILTCGPN